VVTGSENAGAPKTRVFISYSRKDMAFADRLEVALTARGFEPLIDRTEIYAFEDWWKRIEGLISRADTVVFILSPDAAASEIALKEVAYAASLNKRFAPIVCRKVEASAVPEPLRRLNFILFDNSTCFETSVDVLAAALTTDIGWIRQHTEYGEAERRWSAVGRPAGLLLHSPTLEVAEHWIANRPNSTPEPTKEIQAFVATSRKRARAAQRLWRATQTSIVTMLIAIIIGLVGWINQSYVMEQWRWYSISRPFMAGYVRPYVLSRGGEAALQSKDSFRECATDQSKDFCPEMIVVPAGSFVMGSPLTEVHRHADEGPQHYVTIAKPFAVSKFELTFEEWDTCVVNGNCAQGAADMGWGRGDHPAINVSWDDAQRYGVWLSRMTGKSYRLLSEAEYEFATRAGTTTAYPWGDDVGQNNANCNGCGSKWDWKGTVPVGSFLPNKFGLYEIVGNLWEWTEDCYHNSYEGAPSDGSAWISGVCSHRVVRGGAYNRSPEYLRSANRQRFTADSRIDVLGFRVGRTLDQ
jgi:formylglycine-generating enzyme required for sulfatase activity